MIPRTLVPVGARPPADPGATSRRRPTNLDERKLVPAMLPVIPLNGHSSIPANLPLESIAARVVVPRDVKPEAYAPGNETALPPQPSELDERIAVPAGAAPPAVIEPISVPPPADIVELDVFMTGEVNLIPEPPKEGTAWNQIATRAFSISMHLLLVLLIIFQAKLFPHREPTPQETEFAKNQLRLLLPPGAFEPAPPRPPQPRVRVDPRVLKRVAPPEPAPAPVVPAPAPVPEKPKELPNAPTPQPNASPPPATPEPKTEALAPKPKLETPDTPQPRSRCLKNMRLVFPDGARLLHRLFRTANHMLILNRLNPKMRREIRNVRNQSRKRPPRMSQFPCLCNLPIEMRNHGNQQISVIFSEIIHQQAHQRPVKNPDRCLQHTQQLRRAQRPPISQQRVVLFLNADPGQLAQHIQTVGKLLKLHKFHLPSAILLGNNRLQRHRRVSMSAACIVEQHLNFLHRLGIVSQNYERPAKSRGHALCHVENLQSHLCSISSALNFIGNLPLFYVLFISRI